MDLIVAATNIGHALREIFLLPGQRAAAFLETSFPQLALLDRSVGVAAWDPLPLFLSIAFWLLLVVALLRGLRSLSRLLRIVDDRIDSLRLHGRLGIYRLNHAVRTVLARTGLKTEETTLTAASLDLDDTDVAVLKVARSRCPGLTISAPDLVEHLHTRPVVIQRHLQRLAGYQLLENVMGSTDGFDNFTLTQIGAAFARRLP